jgi:hypothetical protein
MSSAATQKAADSGGLSQQTSDIDLATAAVLFALIGFRGRLTMQGLPLNKPFVD